MDTVFWHKFMNNANCDLYPQSKVHFTDDLGVTTLCGTPTPATHDAEISGMGDSSHVECKRCQKKYNQIIRDDEILSDNDLDHDSSEEEEQPSKEDVAQWLMKNPQVGTLNNGTFYISTPEMTEYPYYEVVKPLQILK